MFFFASVLERFACGISYAGCSNAGGPSILLSGLGENFCFFCSKKWSYSETIGVRLTQELAAEIRQMAPKGVSHILLTHDDFVPWLQEIGQKQENSFLLASGLFTPLGSSHIMMVPWMMQRMGILKHLKTKKRKAKQVSR